MLKGDSSTYLISNSVLAVFIFVSIFFLIKSALAKSNKRLLTISLILGFLFSMFMICGVTTYLYKSTFLNSSRTIFRIICGIPLWTTLIIHIFCFLDFFRNNVNKKLGESTCFNCSRKKFFLINWCFVFLAWLPVLMAAFPGIYGYDSVFQLGYYLTGKISLHHPLIHTYLLGGCVKTLGDFLGSYEKGLLVYSLLQMIVLSFLVALITFYIKIKNIDVRFYFIVTVLLMICPYNSIMSVSATKDVLYAGFFNAFIFLLLYGIYTNGFKNIKLILLMIISAFLMCIFRNQGFYVFVLGCIISTFLLKQYRKQILIVFMVV